MKRASGSGCQPSSRPCFTGIRALFAGGPHAGDLSGGRNIALEPLKQSRGRSGVEQYGGQADSHVRVSFHAHLFQGIQPRSLSCAGVYAPEIADRAITARTLLQTLQDRGESSTPAESLVDDPRGLSQQIGLPRQVTFRRVGEGTGKMQDLDSFDDYYKHLVLWSKTRQEPVGTYRLGNAEQIIAARGIRGLDTNTLFHYDSAFFRKIGPALELGRSLIRLEYQKKYAPLMLLWKGLAKLVQALRMALFRRSRRDVGFTAAL